MLMSDMQMSYTVTLSVLGGLVFLFAIAAVTPSYPQVSTGFQMSMALQLLGRPAVLLAALTLIGYMSLEPSMSTWIKPLLTELDTKEGNPAAMRNAGYVLALFGLTMAIGRFIASSIKNLSALGSNLIAICAVVAIGAIGLLATTTTSTMAIVAIALIGLVFAPIFPTIVGVTFGKYEPKLYGSIFGIIFSVGLLGSMLVPKAIGMFSVGSSLQQGLWIAAGMAGVLLVLSLVLGKAKG
jgi:predicted MFS family arabinose efflux permease